MRSNASASIGELMNEEAEFVRMVAFLRDIGGDATWKQVVPKKQWKIWAASMATLPCRLISWRKSISIAQTQAERSRFA